MKTIIFQKIKLVIIIYDTIVLLISKLLFLKKRKIKKYAIINIGGLGDSIVFLSVLKSYKKDLGEDTPITIVINKDFSDIFSFLNNGDFKIYEIDVKKYSKNILYRTVKNLTFSNYSFEFVINGRGVRTGIYEDSILRFIKGKKIGLIDDKNYHVNGTSSIISSFLNIFVYDKSINFDFKNISHEVNRLKILFDYAFHTKHDLKSIYLDNHLIQDKYNIGSEKKYFVLNIGAGKQFRKWPTENFIELSNKIYKYNGLIPIFCGLEEDQKDLINSDKIINENAINLCGKINLIDLIKILKYSEFCISNDSGPANISCMLRTKTICVKNHFGDNRFFPYPKNLSIDEITFSKKNIYQINVDDVYNKIIQTYC